MMKQTFGYPNLATMTDKAEGFYLVGSNIGAIKPTVGTDDVVGRYFRFVCPTDEKGWLYIKAGLSNDFGDVPEGTRLALSALLRVNGGPESMAVSLRKTNSTESVADNYKMSFRDIGGGWRHVFTTCVRNATDFTEQVLYIWLGNTRVAGTAFDVAQLMACVADEPHAWAPAEGEVWPE